MQRKQMAGWSAVALISLTVIILIAQWSRTIPDVAVFISYYRGTTALPTATAGEDP